MNNFMLGNVKIVILSTEVTFQEVKRLADIEIEEADAPLNRITINLDAETDEYIVQSFRKSPISRIRRITGYLSDFNNFNEAKKEEADNRLAHQKVTKLECLVCGSENNHIKKVMAEPERYEYRIICDDCKAERVI